jgi:probable rRNA maturation factor
MPKDLDLVFRDLARDATPWRGLTVRTVRAARPYLKVPRGKTAELSVTLVGPTKMRALNRRYRKVDKPTDVLSFPLPGPNIAGYTAVSLGDLFICPKVVREKAKEWDRAVRTQMQWTIVHGLLHLAGHDHETSARAAARMAAVEKKILKKL